MPPGGIRSSSYPPRAGSKIKAAIVLNKTTIIDPKEPIWEADLSLSDAKDGKPDRSRCLGFAFGEFAAGSSNTWMLGEYVQITNLSGAPDPRFRAEKHQARVNAIGEHVTTDVARMPTDWAAQ